MHVRDPHVFVHDYIFVRTQVRKATYMLEGRVLVFEDKRVCGRTRVITRCCGCTAAIERFRDCTNVPYVDRYCCFMICHIWNCSLMLYHMSRIRHFILTSFYHIAYGLNALPESAYF